MNQVLRHDVELQWVSPPKQARSQARLERMLDAAELVIAERGFEQAPVAEIMAKAGSSVGLFYQRFKSKDDLLRCLMARFTEETIATCNVVLSEDVWRGDTIAAIIERLVPFLFDVYRARRGLLRAFLRRASVDADFSQEAHRAEEYVAERLQRLLLDRTDQIAHPDPASATQLAYQMLRSTLNTMILFDLKEQAGFSIDDPGIADDLAQAFLRVLSVRKPKADSVARPSPRGRKLPKQTQKTRRRA